VAPVESFHPAVEGAELRLRERAVAQSH
jgi:hypothetical protein